MATHSCQRSCCGLPECLHHPVHVVNALVTPEVCYDSWREFVDLVYWVQDAFCALVAAAVLEESLVMHKSLLLGNVFSSLPSLDRLKEQGPAIIMRLTKNEGLFWCKMVSHFVCCRALRAAVIFEDVRSCFSEGGLDNENIALMSSVMQQEVRHTFSGAMPFSIFTLCSGFVSTLLVKNFVIYDDQQLTAFTHKQFTDILLALCMGLHPRLGEHSPLLPLTNDVLRLACARLCASELEKHIVFHTQEQWLY